jgi:predicted Holliday junction resolvase-like endonuclease
LLGYRKNSALWGYSLEVELLARIRMHKSQVQHRKVGVGGRTRKEERKERMQEGEKEREREGKREEETRKEGRRNKKVKKKKAGTSTTIQTEFNPLQSGCLASIWD